MSDEFLPSSELHRSNGKNVRNIEEKEVVKCHTKGRRLSCREFVRGCYLAQNCFIYGLSDYKAACSQQSGVGSEATCPSHMAQAFRELEINALAKQTLSSKERLQERVMGNN